MGTVDVSLAQSSLDASFNAPSKTFRKRGSEDGFVNGERLLQSRRLEHRDFLRVGVTHVFQLLIPKVDSVPENVAACLHDGLSATKLILAQDFAVHLEARFGSQQA